MATLQCFEELEIWNKAQDLGAMVYQLSEVNQKIVKDFSLKTRLKSSFIHI